ncbi:MAG: hypothetical protein ACOYIT_07510 [Christensenellales bacterium]
MAKKSKIRAAWGIARLSLSAWADSPRAPFVMIAMIMMCFGALGELGNSLKSLGDTITVFEAPLFTFQRQTLLAGTLFLLLMIDLPRKGRFQNYQLIRTNRSGWLLGQIIYCCLMIVVFLAVMIILSFLFALPFVKYQNIWSDTIRETENFFLPSQAIFPLATRQTMSPLEALALNCLLCACYWLGLSFFILLGGLFGQSLYGIIPAMIVQLLPWIIDTLTNTNATWFPNAYASIFHPAYQGGNASVSIAISILSFSIANFLLIGVMFWRVKKADLVFFVNQGGFNN